MSLEIKAEFGAGDSIRTIFQITGFRNKMIRRDQCRTPSQHLQVRKRKKNQ